MTESFVCWSNHPKKLLAGLVLYDIVKSREGGLTGLKGHKPYGRGQKNWSKNETDHNIATERASETLLR